MILALQFYEGDQTKALALAKLLADIEPKYREDVTLGLVTQPDTPDCNEITNAVAYCSNKFKTVYVKSTRGGKGWRDGSGQLWCGTMEHFSNNPMWHTSIFTFDGGDGVPLRTTWIDDLKKEHEKTTQKGKLVSATFYHDFINGNMVTELDLWRKHLSLHPLKLLSKDGLCDIWERQFKETMVPLANPSKIVRNDWDQHNVTNHKLIELSKEFIWLHGYKDTDLVDTARLFLLPKTLI
jgi:hypothetical protein